MSITAERKHGAHQGIRHQGRRHRFAGSAGRDPVRAHQQPDRASGDHKKDFHRRRGLLMHGRPAPPPARLPEAQERRALRGADRAPGPAPLSRPHARSDAMRPRASRHGRRSDRTPRRPMPRRGVRTSSHRRDSAYPEAGATSGRRRTAVLSALRARDPAGRQAIRMPHRGRSAPAMMAGSPPRARDPEEGKTHNVQRLPQGNRSGAGASSSSRPARSPARPTAPCWRPTARPSCCAPPSARARPKPGQDFFPLTVNYQEKTFAAGKIPGGFFKREGRPTEKEMLISRLIDRPIRPLFPHGLPQRDPGRLHRAEPRPGERSRHRRPDRRLGGADHLRHPVHGPDRRAPASATSTASTCSTRRSTRWRQSQLDLVVAGTAEGVLMVESEAKELSEDVMLGAVTFGHAALPAGDRRDHRAGRALRQGALGAAEQPRRGRGASTASCATRVGRAS